MYVMCAILQSVYSLTILAQITINYMVVYRDKWESIHVFDERLYLHIYMPGFDIQGCQTARASVSSSRVMFGTVFSGIIDSGWSHVML